METSDKKRMFTLRVTEDERNFIIAKQKASKISSINAYLKKMAIDGEIKVIDFSELKKTNAEIGAISRNINQLVKKIHGYGTVYDEDLNQIKKLMEDIWQLQKSILSNQL